MEPRGRSGLLHWQLLAVWHWAWEAAALLLTAVHPLQHLLLAPLQALLLRCSLLLALAGQRSWQHQSAAEAVAWPS
jgi:hypothetical protein